MSTTSLVWALRRALIVLHTSDSDCQRMVAQECADALLSAGESIPAVVDLDRMQAYLEEQQCKPN